MRTEEEKIREQDSGSALSDEELDEIIRRAFGGRDPEAVSPLRYAVCSARAIWMGFWRGCRKGFAESRADGQNV